MERALGRGGRDLGISLRSASGLLSDLRPVLSLVDLSFAFC